MIEDPESHDSARLTVLDPVDEIADIVKISGDPGEFDRSFVVPERFEYVPRGFGNKSYVSETVLGKSERGERHIRLTDIGSDFFVVLDFFVRHIIIVPFLNKTLRPAAPARQPLRRR